MAVLLPNYSRTLLVLYVIQLFIHKGCECVRVTVLFQGNFKGLPFEDDIENNNEVLIVCPA